jgi:hypothetical protein
MYWTEGSVWLRCVEGFSLILAVCEKKEGLRGWWGMMKP